MLAFASVGHATVPKTVAASVALSQLGAQARDIVAASQQAQETASHTVESGRPVELSTLEAGLQQIQRDIVDLEKLLDQVQRAWAEDPNDSP